VSVVECIAATECLTWEAVVALATIALTLATLAIAGVALFPIVADARRRRREGQSFRALVRIAALDHIRRISAHADGSTSGTQRNVNLVRDAARELKEFVPDSHVLSEAEADALSAAAERSPSSPRTPTLMGSL